MYSERVTAFGLFTLETVFRLGENIRMRNVCRGYFGFARPLPPSLSCQTSVVAPSCLYPKALKNKKTTKKSDHPESPENTG